MAAALAATAAIASSIGVAAADTTGTPDPVTRATVTTDATQSGVAPNGPMKGLVEGSNIHIHSTITGGNLFSLTARLCKSGVDINSSARFSPTQLGNCINQQFVPGSDDDFVQVPTNSPFTTADLDFRVGTGTDSFTSTSGGPTTITCTAASPCALWLDHSVDTTTAASGHVWKHFDVTYAGQPGAPAASATGGNTTATVTWTAPASTGNAAITNYTVTFTGGPSTPASPVTVSGTTLSQAFTGLTNFSTYTATVQAQNTAADGSTHFVSPASAPATVTPAPPGPTNVSGVPADQKVDLTWTAPAGPTPDEYEVTASPAPATPPAARLTGSSATSYSFTGLTNGTPYTFTVRARYGTSFGSASAPSAAVAPAGALITQTITVTRPQGALILTQVCGAKGSTHTGTAPTLPGGAVDPNFDPVAGEYPYPPNFTPNYPTNCNVNLGTSKLIATGPGANQFFDAKGDISQVTVTDFRDTDPGWTVTGRMGNFVSGPNSFSGNQLGWTPAATDAAPFTDGAGNTYDQTAVPGGVVAPNTNPGLGAGQELAHAVAGSGEGRARLDAALDLWIPVSAKAGSYTGTLTITAV
ncbi:MAG: fibronectin type III domain-containing protein [Actinomycetota bacterium]|nr:fibronectin type III domain-containing protein [Actinomycetota bacterium]